MEDLEPKVLLFNQTARESLLRGVDTLANAVKVTLGPQGQTVAIERRGATPVLTKDGVTVARAINLKDPAANLGVQLVKEAASRTADVAGDGTTTATVLAQSIFSQGMKMIAAGASPMEIKRGIDEATSDVVKFLKQLAVVTEDYEVVAQVGTISANGEVEIGRLLSDALSKVGRDGVVSVEEAKGYKTSLNVVEGLQIDRGYLSPYFITNQEKMSVELNDPLVLLSNVRIQNIKDILSLLEKVHEAGRPLLVVADEVEGDALQAMVVNKLKGVLQICAIKAPGFGEARLDYLNDLTALLGGSVVTEASDLRDMNFDLARLGSCNRVVSSRNNTVFISGTQNPAVASRIEELRARQADPTVAEDEKLLIRTRIAKLQGGVAVLRVGGSTEVELKERKDRVDDALSATQAALEEGIVPGGGVALVRAGAALKVLAKRTSDFGLGYSIIKNACEAPLRQIVVNAGKSPDVVLDKVVKQPANVGYDARNHVFGDMLTSGIVDPVKVVRTALENAASVAGTMLTVGCVMVDEQQE